MVYSAYFSSGSGPSLPGTDDVLCWRMLLNILGIKCRKNRVQITKPC